MPMPKHDTSTRVQLGYSAALPEGLVTNPAGLAIGGQISVPRTIENSYHFLIPKYFSLHCESQHLRLISSVPHNPTNSLLAMGSRAKHFYCASYHNGELKCFKTYEKRSSKCGKSERNLEFCA